MARKASTLGKQTSKSTPAVKRQSANTRTTSSDKARSGKPETVPRTQVGIGVDTTPRLHPIAQDQSRMVKVQWSHEFKRFEAEMIHIDEARKIATVSHPPTVTPVPHDPDRVVRCDWDIAANEYRCDIIDATDPRARV